MRLSPEIDGAYVPGSYLSVSEDLKSITISDGYLTGLSAGKHEVRIITNGGEAVFELNIEASPWNVGLIAGIAAASVLLTAAIVTLLLLLKKRNNRKEGV